MVAIMALCVDAGLVVALDLLFNGGRRGRGYLEGGARRQVTKGTASDF